MPPPNPTPHRTPLRRVSQGSLFALSRSRVYPEAPHGLGFLELAMTEFVDETETLQTNVEAMKNLSDSLATFNESFASLLYIMEMNALTTDWPQAPTDASFLYAQRRTERNAMAAMEAANAAQEAKAQAQAAAADKTAMTEAAEGDVTVTNTTNISGNSSKAGTTVKKQSAKPKISAKEKKERSIEIERVIMSLPLEFRGSDPDLRRNMENVIEGLMDAPNKCTKLVNLIKVPDLPQARVNKCLIALVNRKIVHKDNSTGTVLYRWQGLS